MRVNLRRGIACDQALILVGPKELLSRFVVVFTTLTFGTLK